MKAQADGSIVFDAQEVEALTQSLYVWAQHANYAQRILSEHGAPEARQAIIGLRQVEDDVNMLRRKMDGLYAYDIWGDFVVPIVEDDASEAASEDSAPRSHEIVKTYLPDSGIVIPERVYTDSPPDIEDDFAADLKDK